MKYILSRFNHDISWLKDYTDDYVLYDRSPEPIDGSIQVRNVGSDLYDKFTYIIDHYRDLPPVAVYTKANLFKYITKEEFDEIKDNTTFTPILTQNHRTYKDANGMDVCFYENGLYFEINNKWYLSSHPVRDTYFIHQIEQITGTYGKSYVPFAPGSNYILPKEHILQHPKEVYEKLRGYLGWNVYPGEAMLIERGLYLLWS